MRLARSVTAGIVMLVITGSFLGITAPVLNTMQFFPALLAANGIVLIGIAAVTLLFGRVYCSVLCPLGIWQDGVLWLAAHGHKIRRPFFYRQEKIYLRYTILLILALFFAFGNTIIPILLDPYSIYGRMVIHMLVPFWQQAAVSSTGSGESGVMYMLSAHTNLWQGTAAFILSAAYIAGIGILSWKYGRLYCNTICPVGTILGSISRFSKFRLIFHSRKCIRCGRCEKICRASCIDMEMQTVDMSRCVDCMNCLTVCPQKAIVWTSRFSYQVVSPHVDVAEPAMSRREMIILSGVALGTAAIALSKHYLPAGAAIIPAASKGSAVMPPGAMLLVHFAQRCTACHLCVGRCPGKVLTSKLISYHGFGVFQPHLDFSEGECVYTCNLCSQVCPTGAIRPIALPEKQHLKIGRAVYYPFHCLIIQEGIACGICARHCPTKAIQLIPKESRWLPQVDSSDCIGCGACQYHCPATPTAITVEAFTEQIASRKK